MSDASVSTPSQVSRSVRGRRFSAFASKPGVSGRRCLCLLWMIPVLLMVSCGEEPNIAAGTTWRGKCAQPDQQPYPMIMRVRERDGRSFSGTLRWPTLRNSKTRFTGSITADGHLRFVETEVISGSGIAIPAVYEGRLHGATISGTARYAEKKATYYVARDRSSAKAGERSNEVEPSRSGRRLAQRPTSRH